MAAEESVASSADPEGITPLPSSLSIFAILEMPEDCLLRVLSALSALDVCRVARVCRRLRVIADSDHVWASRLPSNPAINPPSLSRKDLYFRLRAGMLHKELSQPYWMDPETGEGCFVKSARDLRIVWGDDARYWRWERQPDSWFAESAWLIKVCWFEVTGEFENMFLPGVYTASFRIKFADSSVGWAQAPVKLSLSTSNGQYVESQCFLRFGRKNAGLSNPAQIRSLTSCWWMELDIGDFVVHREMHVKLEIRMLEIEGGSWKHGVLLESLKIQPRSAITRNV